MLLLPVACAWDQVDIDIVIHAQQAVDDRAAQQLLPGAAGWLAQDDLRDLTLACHLDQRAGDIRAAHTDDLGPQIFGEHDMLLQATLGYLSLSDRIAAIFEQAYESTHE